jgi:hypothetical protein
VSHSAPLEQTPLLFPRRYYGSSLPLLLSLLLLSPSLLLQALPSAAALALVPPAFAPAASAASTCTASGAAADRVLMESLRKGCGRICSCGIRSSGSLAPVMCGAGATLGGCFASRVQPFVLSDSLSSSSSADLTRHCCSPRTTGPQRSRQSPLLNLVRSRCWCWFAGVAALPERANSRRHVVLLLPWTGQLRARPSPATPPCRRCPHQRCLDQTQTLR